MSILTFLPGNIYEEAVKVLLTLAGSYAFYRLTLKQPRLTYFLSGFASCRVNVQAGQPPIVWIYQITIQNTGKAPAQNVRVAHHFMPLHWQVIQAVPYTVEQIEGRDRIIRFASIEPGMLVTIAFLDTDHIRITTAHDHVRSDEGVVQPTPVQLQRVYPKRVLYATAALLLLGFYVVISFTYNVVRWLWPVISAS